MFFPEKGVLFGSNLSAFFEQESAKEMQASSQES
jgi:hypothetical protein